MKKLLLCLLMIALFIPTPHPKYAIANVEEVLFIGKGLSPDALCSPSYVAADQHRLNVVDESLQQIAYFSSNLDRMGTFGSFGQSEGEFDGLGRMRISDNLLFVLDRHNKRIQVLFNQEALTIDAAPEIVKSSTFVPLIVVSDILGARIEWFASEQLIRIEYW